jgi:methylated-DNA-[protein]-cysteine S-methyltransferase
MSISSLVVPSPLGPLTLFAEDGAMISLDWGKGAIIEGPDTPLLQTAAEQLKLYFAGELKQFDLPLKPEGTEFQKKVWDIMLSIPFGETKTYGEVATMISSAPRAVGGACGANPLPIIIPCHRILAAEGKMGGYSGDGETDTKIALLQLEGIEA